ncbi:MAG: Fic family protein [Cytophagales bacterium]|nr:Fic family protein [Cytophagales bacterium]
MKYQLPENQMEILPNLLGLTSPNEIALSEFEGFLKCEILLTEKLTSRTKFTLNYILKIHQLALGHLYSFAGKYRDVNISKGGFPFAAAKYLPETMKLFEAEVLTKLPTKYAHRSELIKDIAIVHGELLVIHPIREGNGRTARILANLMARKFGFGPLNFGKIGETEFQWYISAVQKSAERDYQKMIEFVEFIFPN